VKRILVLKTPTISIVIPVFNGVNTIDRCLESVAMQSFPDFEVIVVDDGSADETAMKARKWSARDDRFRLLQIDHSGVSFARCAGLELASSSLISFIDADDIISPLFLQKLHAAMLATDSDIAECARLKTAPGAVPVWTDSHSAPLVFEQPMLLRRVLRYENYSIGLWNKLYKKDLFEGIEWPPVSFHEDEALLPLVAERANLMSQIEDCCYAYVQREESLTNTKELDSSLMDLLSILEHRYKHFLPLGDQEVNEANLECLSSVCFHYREHFSDRLSNKAIETLSSIIKRLQEGKMGD